MTQDKLDANVILPKEEKIFLLLLFCTEPTVNRELYYILHLRPTE